MNDIKDFLVIDGDKIVKCKKKHGVKSVVIPDGIKTVGKYAFMNDAEITEVWLPSSVTRIEYQAFFRCINIEKVRFSPGNKVFGESVFCGSGLKTVELPHGLKTLSAYMFGGCDKLEHVYIPDTVEVIENHAFSNCKKLKSIFLPKSVKIVQESVFYGCDRLEIYCEAEPTADWIDNVKSFERTTYTAEDDAFNFHRSSGSWSGRAETVTEVHKWNRGDRPVHTHFTREQYNKISE